jgi:predicted transcriptional regulator
MKLLFKHALNYIKNEDDIENNDIKTQIITAIKLLENDEIDCSNISILNINNEITKSLKLLFENLIIIHTKVILREALYKFKFNTVCYHKLSEKMLEKYKQSAIYLKTKLENLSEGIELKKFHFSSKGHTIHFYKISTQENDNYNLMIYKKINDNKPMKVIPLSEIIDITVGCNSANLQKRLYPNVIKKYKPWLFLSIYFAKRTIDLYFENDEQINDWFEGIYYYMWKISFNKNLPNFNLFFLTKLKLKLLYKLKDMNVNLSILDQIKAFEKENEIEFQSLPINKAVLLYVKICEKLGRNIDY